MDKPTTKLDLITRFAQRRHDALKKLQQQEQLADIKQASVLIPIIDTQDLNVIFTERTAHLKNHAGQISFPGGRREKTDQSLEETCLRETTEEIGIHAKYITLIGNLASMNSSSGFSVTPFVGLIDPNYTLQIDPFEVASIFTVPLNFLLDSNNHQQQKYLYQGKPRPIYVIEYKQYRIWGLTAKIIVDLAEALKSKN